MKFLDLVTHIAEVDDVARLSAGRLVQQALSLVTGSSVPVL